MPRVTLGPSALLIAGAMLLMITIGTRVNVAAQRQAETPAATSRLPAPAPALGTERTFIGAKVCASCHAAVHDTWQSGRHSKMLQPATAQSVKGRFSGVISLRGKRYRLRTAEGGYYITESDLSGREHEYRIEFTLGSRRIQHYITTLENGRMVLLAPSWDVTRGEWFHNLEIVRPDEDDHGIVQQWNKNCFGCHVSQQQNNYRPDTRTYATQWVDFGTSCERCHGPGSAHVADYFGAVKPKSITPGLIVRARRIDSERGSMICAQCHSFRNIVASGFRAGADYYDFFMPVLEYASSSTKDPSFWGDGRPRRFSNDAIGLWQSQCFLQGGATCTNCHTDPHKPDIDRNPQLAPTNNAICTRCHTGIEQTLTSHTRHRADSRGSSCVECHMPNTVVGIRTTMRDHSISLPTPENTVAFDIPNACTECHRDRGPKWAVEMMQAWWPEGRRFKFVARARAFAAARAGDAAAVMPLLHIAADRNQGPLIQATALGHLRTYHEPAVTAALHRAARDDHPVVRGVALSSLGYSSDPAARATLLAALDDQVRTVRIAALMALINDSGGSAARVPSSEETRRFRAVVAEFAEQARLHAHRAAIALEITFSLEPRRPTVKFLLALARLGQQRPADARALLNEVPRSDTFYDQAQEMLKTLRP
jgi:predicted CXXCH cytochrome family protein